MTNFKLLTSILTLFPRILFDLDDPIGVGQVKPSSLRPEYDFIVIGSGASGSVVAARGDVAPVINAARAIGSSFVAWSTTVKSCATRPVYVKSEPSIPKYLSSDARVCTGGRADLCQ